MIANLICKIRGHLRGKRLAPSPEETLPVRIHRFECPRCKATWSRPARKAA